MIFTAGFYFLLSNIRTYFSSWTEAALCKSAIELLHPLLKLFQPLQPFHSAKFNSAHFAELFQSGFDNDI